MILDFKFFMQYILLTAFMMNVGIIIDLIATARSIKYYKSKNKIMVRFFYYLMNIGEQMTSIGFTLLCFIPVVIILIIIF